ncbi:MAG: hypothetical protein FD144_5925 [Rhodospirillaceae bacterium]|nr:MAG: hypothetical protein FD144_5925 [Rhodospirillaceae bacterium]
MAKKRKDRNEREGADASAPVEQLNRVAMAARRSRGKLEPALSVAIRLARAEIEEFALILKHADGRRFKAANERVPRCRAEALRSAAPPQHCDAAQ